MRIIPEQEFIDWCFNQPDSREVNFCEVLASDQCGCAMIQFGRELGLEFTVANSRGLYDCITGDTVLRIDFNSKGGVIILTPPKYDTNYGKFKEHLQQLGYEKS